MKFPKRKSVQDIQDGIFRKMSAEASVRLVGGFFRAGKILNALGANYGTARASQKNRQHSSKA